MRILAIANQKGGCGKTTTSINFSACLAHLQKKVLLVDLDPQGHSTCGLGIRAETLPFTLYDLLRPSEQPIDPAASIQSINPNFYLLPSYDVLSRIEEELAHRPDRYRRLGHELNRISQIIPDLDFILIDCPPNLGVLTYSALEAADEVIIPIEPSFFSLHGLAKISETMQNVNQRRETPIEIHSLLTIFNSRTCFAKEVYEDVKQHFNERLFRTIIHESVTLKEAAASGQSIVQYDPESSAFRDYFNLAVEYLEREWNRLLPEHELGWKNILANRFGPQKAVDGVLFQLLAKNARWVEIAGDFNNWVPESLVRRDPDGLWQKVIPLAKGTFRYKYIVDGEWQIDPYHPSQRINDFGTLDSYLEIS